DCVRPCRCVNRLSLALFTERSMHLFAVTSANRKARLWLIALGLLVPAVAGAKADPRIDQDTATSRNQQIAALQKGPDGLIQQACVASWYGRHWRGRKTANGMIFDERQLTAASLALPLATRARVTNLQNGRSVDVLVNDRGPYIGNPSWICPSAPQRSSASREPGWGKSSSVPAWHKPETHAPNSASAAHSKEPRFWRGSFLFCRTFRP